MDKIDEFAVKQVKGPFVVLPKHANYCEEESQLIRYAEMRRKEGALLGADLFSGAGGLSEGLGNSGIETILGVDHYSYAVETHAARFPGMSVDWNLATSDNVKRVAELMLDAGIEVLAGGPPCQPFSKAGRSGIRHLIEHGERDPDDQRRHLWRAYLEVVQLAQPKAVIMENVPDMALDDEMFILRSMIEELEQMNYSVEARVIETWRYGVPQFRQRLILVALKDQVQFTWPEESTKKITVWNAISDMPKVEGGWRPPGGAEGWTQYDGPRTKFQKYMRRNVSKEDEDKLFDHITRPVREDDREAFSLMTSDTKYSDLPKHLQRYRSDIFTDKYKRLDENDLSRTITAHIAKDGYGFIHPRQSRTLTVREAARLQTFPDDFRFSGPPSAAFKQIGNAVPVRLGEAIGRAVVSSLQTPEKKAVHSRLVAGKLADWYRKRTDDELAQPWLRSGSRWKVVICEIFLDRASYQEVRFLWPLINSLVGPDDQGNVPEDAVSTIRAVFAGARFEYRRNRFNLLLKEMSKYPGSLFEREIDREKLPTINPALAKLLELAAPEQDQEGKKSEEPVIVAKGILRVTSRVQGHDFESRNRQTDGRISVARMLGLNSDSREAQIALFEIARTVCLNDIPHCSLCPLADVCKKFAVQEQNSGQLF